MVFGIVTLLSGRIGCDHGREILPHLILAFMACEILDSLHITSHESVAALTRNCLPSSIKARNAAPQSVDVEHRRPGIFIPMARGDVRGALLPPLIPLMDVTVLQFFEMTVHRSLGLSHNSAAHPDWTVPERSTMKRAVRLLQLYYEQSQEQLWNWSPSFAHI